jgi:hypothetical protein
MRGDPWHREPPLRATTVEAVFELSSALHDCWIDVEGIAPERIERRIVSYRFPLALDEAEYKLLPCSDWELMIRNPTSFAIEDSALISSYCLNTIRASEDEVAIDAEPDVSIRIGVRALDVAVEPRFAQSSRCL